MTVRENLEKAAYTAIGAPVIGARTLKAKAERLAESVRETRRELKGDALREFDEWVAEGEMVVDRMLEWLRSTGAGTELRSARQTAAEQVRSGVSELTDRIDDAIDFVEPDIHLTEIRGIGPASAQKLAAAGVPGIAAFLEKTDGTQRMQRLSEETGISIETFEEWRMRADLTRVDGIGDAYQRMLHAAGIGTMTHLANAQADELAKELESIDRPGMPKQDPAKNEIAGWIKEAGRLSLEDSR